MRIGRRSVSVRVPASSKGVGQEVEEGSLLPGKSSREDRNEGAMDRAKGRMKEAGGSLTGDKKLKREGGSDQRKGKGKDKKAAAKDLLK